MQSEGTGADSDKRDTVGVQPRVDFMKSGPPRIGHAASPRARSHGQCRATLDGGDTRPRGGSDGTARIAGGLGGMPMCDAASPRVVTRLSATKWNSPD
jgi:hypothetical protein